MIPSLFPAAGESVIWRVCWHASLTIVLVQLICCLIPAMPGRMRSWLWRLAIIKLIVVLVWSTPVELPVLPPHHAATATIESSHSIVAALVERTPTSSGWKIGISVLWGIGAGNFLLQIVNSYRELVQFRCQCHPIDHPLLANEFADCVRSLRFSRFPQLLVCAGTGSPFVIGIRHPAVVLPQETWQQLSTAERQMALRHELAHLRHGDLVWNLLAALVRSFLFFHPLAWWAERELRTSHEMSADELAIRTQGCDAVDYGKLLLSIVHQSGTAEFPSTMAVGAAGSVGMLTRRLAAMRFMNRVSGRAVYSSAACVALIAAIGIVPWRLVTPFGSQQPPAIPLLSVTNDRDAAQRTTAEIRISRCSGQQDSPLSKPTVEFSGDSEVTLPIDNEHSIQVAVETNRQESPLTHSVRVTFIENPQSETPKRLFAPRVTLFDGSNAIVQDLDANGEGLKVEVAVSAVPSNR
ncbi:M56 family metallopeptidase [Schlesneria paludicola]|uniref:M56 family metallopeptidase n=1 Tax=Schlesneria paludicola TaxID=360056 RepID=UPI00029B314D|nr:M56 family metallopeptidase [Schlesneria paludicola]